ncbi:AraC family transcriptional regulator [Pandoraea commovens]|uniref:AraC family transcriptional regulator n=1 Tax=Pandoraea commovens TaxID=2508289 RepID=A0A5E4XNJ0_9BURK|nr:AraC family transcriptional regulator [Pandoraea commovens]
MAVAGFYQRKAFSKTFGLMPGRWLQVASGILPG